MIVDDPLLDEVVAGLSARPKVLPTSLLYDPRGSLLFEQITALPEYDLTRAEAEILEAHGADIARALAPPDDPLVLLEPGCGSSAKAAEILRHHRDAHFVGVDISADALARGARRLRQRAPGVQITSIVGDFRGALPRLPAGRRAAFFPGSTLGNFEPDDAAAFVARLARRVGPDGHVVLGLDRWKDPEVLRAAYDDAQGVTAAFNRNALAHLAARFDAEVDPDDFDHVVVVDVVARRVEMWLRARRRLTIRVAGRVFTFDSGESVRTEHCYKFDAARVAALVQASGTRWVRAFTDHRGRFEVHLLRGR